jgi:hypothetical protein
LSWWGSKDWANQELRYAIKVLRFEAFRSRKLTDYLALALDIKGWLEDEGFWWQARTLDYHIHLWQAKHREALGELRREAGL